VNTLRNSEGAGLLSGSSGMSHGVRAHDDAIIHGSVIQANIDFYKDVASTYDSYESCAFDRFLQGMLDEDLDRIAPHFIGHRNKIRCLDCGGGTGNLTLKLLQRGWQVTVVDISTDMLRLSEAKIRDAGFSAVLLNDSVEHFLTATGETFDLVAFSSVLHHLFSPGTIIEQVSARIVSGGYFYSNFDPVMPHHPRWTRCFSNADTLIAKALYDPADICPGIRRRLRKLLAPTGPRGRPVASAGDMAEYHARSGLDDTAIVELLRVSGFDVQHKRYPAARTRLMRSLSRHLRACMNFRILARKSGAHS
jgi:SAM-dependent methyltransferase